MRAIGKGSLASLLAVGLHVTRVILWFVVGGLAIAMLVVPIAPMLAEIFSESDKVDIDGEVSSTVDAFLNVSHSFVTAAIVLFVVNRLLEILKTLRFGSPFVKENANRFRAVGYALLIGEGAKFAFGFLSLVADADVDIETSPITWLAIIAVFVLAEVFHEGARMKEEQDLTV